MPGREVCASHTWVQPFRAASLVWPAASHVFLMLSLRSSVFFCLPLHCWNPFLARPEIPFLCAWQVSEDKETLFLYHHLLHFHQFPGCFSHGILVQPLSSFSSWKRTHWISGRVLLIIFFSLWRSHFIAKTSSPIPVFFFLHTLHLQNRHFWPFKMHF